MFPLRFFLLLVLFGAFQPTGAAQITFQKKIDSLTAAYGLAVMPDGGYVLGGAWDDCVQILRFNPAGALLWAKKICPLKDSDDFETGSLQIIAGIAAGEFFAVLRKDSQAPGADHILNLMKFDDAGNLLWESQLPPYVSFGTFSFGNQVDVAPDGAVWAVHGIGDTAFLQLGQSFNQVLLFKVSPTGNMELRNSYKANVPSTANGVFVKNENEIYVYGGLGISVGDGFILKVNAAGAVQWAKTYKNFFFYRDGGQFANGDFLLYGYDGQGIAFARLRPDGSVAWSKKMAGIPNTNLYTVAADQGIFVAVKNQVAAPVAIVKIAPDAETVEWMRTYEECTSYLALSALATPDNGLIFAQDGNIGVPQTRLLKTDALGQLSPDCVSWSTSAPTIEDVSLEISDMSFILKNGSLLANSNVVSVSPGTLKVDDDCPSQYPEADFLLPDSACAFSPLRFASIGNDVATDWYWDLPGSIDETAQGAVLEDIIYTEEGVYPVAMVQYFGICTDTARGSIRIVPPLTVELFGFGDTLLCPDTVFLAVPQSGVFDTWAWEDGNAPYNRLFDPPKAGTYRLTVYEGLCSATDSFNINMAACEISNIFVPNVFSPDGDSQNDTWEVFVREGVTLLSCAIYDRWGSLLYETGKGGMPFWNGTAHGKAIPPGVYLWLIKLRDADGEEQMLTGDLTLLR